MENKNDLLLNWLLLEDWDCVEDIVKDLKCIDFKDGTSMFI